MKRIGFLICLMLATVAAHATVTSQTISVTYNCTGSTGPYAFTFSASAPAAITVTEGGGLLPTNAYTVTAVNNNLDNGGSVTLNSACTSGQLVITRVTPLTQTSVFTDNMPVPMKTFENGLDKLTEIDQEAQIAINNLQNLGCTAGNVLQSLNGPVCVALPVPSSGSGGGTPQSQINVMAYGAKGDCVTDDRAAIQSALNVQGVSTPQITVYFPAPPGGCYLTSTLTYTGASLQGQAGSGFIGAALGTYGGVVLKGKPGQDILHIPDPTTMGSVNPRTGWSIRDIALWVDDTVDASASFPHRWPGKWVQDGAINSSSNQFTSTKAEFTCGDIGQNILVKGAGTSGADLSTTISAVSPCWNNGTTQITATATTVTLTAAAGTTVTNALTYITPANIPVTQTIGNCGLAADNYDGNSANWHMTGGASTFQPTMWNVTAVATGGKRNNSCGFYFAGTWNPYMLDARNVWSYGPEWGVVEGLVDTNPSLGVAGQDYQKWDHGWLESKYPWISYNNGLITMDSIQITADNGPQILQVEGSNEGAPNGWYIHVPESESFTGAGWRIDGYQATVVQTELCDGRTGSINTINSRFIQSNCGGTLDLNGSNNWLDGGNIPNANIVNLGMDNIYNGAQHQGSSKMVVTTPQTQTLNRGQQAWGTLTPDFIRNGTAPYYSDHDLFIWPQDFTNTYSVNYAVVADTNSWTGNYAAILNSGPLDLFYFNNMYMMGRISTNQIIAGQNIPAGPVLVSFSYKCPVLTTFNATIKAYGGGTTIAGPTAVSCSTSYQTFAMPVADFTSYSGQALDLNLSAGEVDIAWMGVMPIGGVTFTGVTVPGAPAGSYVKADGTGYGYGWLYGYTASITGTSLSATCDSGTTTVTGAIGGEPVIAVRADATDIGGAFNVRASVTSANTVTVYICGTGTPPDGVYNVAVWAHIPPP